MTNNFELPSDEEPAQEPVRPRDSLYDLLVEYGSIEEVLRAHFRRFVYREAL
jgi:hypothetical protein